MKGILLSCVLSLPLVSVRFCLVFVHLATPEALSPIFRSDFFQVFWVAVCGPWCPLFGDTLRTHFFSTCLQTSFTFLLWLFMKYCDIGNIYFRCDLKKHDFYSSTTASHRVFVFGFVTYLFCLDR